MHEVESAGYVTPLALKNFDLTPFWIRLNWKKKAKRTD